MTLQIGSSIKLLKYVQNMDAYIEESKDRRKFLQKEAESHLINLYIKFFEEVKYGILITNLSSQYSFEND